MPRASLGARLARVGRRRCLATAMLSVLVLSIFVLPTTALAATPSAKNAQKATYNEINNEVGAAEGITSEEKSEIHCNRLTNTRYHCVFIFLPPVCDYRGYARRDRGYSYVTFRKYGVEVSLHLSQAECLST